MAIIPFGIAIVVYVVTGSPAWTIGLALGITVAGVAAGFYLTD